jgi:hypothetical protein
MTSEAREQIQLEAVNLSDGDSVAITCPFCNAPHEKKMYVSRVGKAIKFYCHRVSCPARGIIGGEDNYYHAQTKKQFKPKIYWRPTCELTEDVYEELKLRYELTPDHLTAHGVLMEEAPNTRILIFPIISGGTTIGRATKDLSATRTSQSPKAITYREREGEVLFWTRGSERRSGPVYLSESCLDALKIAMVGVRSCALLGTHLGEAEALALAAVTNELVWVLDPDAVATAHKLAKKY